MISSDDRIQLEYLLALQDLLDNHYFTVDAYS